MYLKSLHLVGFKSFGKKSELEFSTPITAVVGPNGSGKSNTAEAFRFVLGEQSMKGLRSKRGEDLIWGGSTDVPRSNRASVKATFDNTKRLLNVDFDEVVIERTVFRDGTNEYAINGSKVRLKDVTELLAAANIGASGHHIISQGEADRVLASSPKERKHMIEDALGLRVYQYKKDESRKKLERTEENKAQVESLRRENAPHLKFLERQVKKMERARTLREELVEKYKDYLKREEQYLSYEREVITGARREPEAALKDVTKRISELEKALATSDEDTKTLAKIEEARGVLGTLRSELAQHTRNVGRLEGQVTYEERRIERERQTASEDEGQPVPYKEAKSLWEDLTRILDTAHDKSGDLGTLRGALQDAQKLLRTFVERHHGVQEAVEPDTKDLERLKTELTGEEGEAARTQSDIEKQDALLSELNAQLELNRTENRDQERELYALKSKETELRSTLAALETRRMSLDREEEEFKREIGEGIALIGRRVNEYKEYELPQQTIELDRVSEDREAQHSRRRELEKLKVRLEELGGANAEDITKEYAEVKERDEFLGKELDDLEASAQSLRDLIQELENELNERFASGVSEIGEQFNTYFQLMFGGGSANLKAERQKKRNKLAAAILGEAAQELDEQSEEETDDLGVDIEVSLPRKRVQNLMVLSGGERALTSIALIFAMSQVNPPPFLILDETDAALDEANSRRYGDLISKLAEKSQLILITHNRETMSRAGVLYGITMGADGVSRILSVKFDEAAAVAK